MYMRSKGLYYPNSPPTLAAMPLPNQPLTFVHICTNKPNSKYILSIFRTHIEKNPRRKTSMCYIFTSTCETDYKLNETEQLAVRLHCGDPSGDLTRPHKTLTEEFKDETNNDMYVVYHCAEKEKEDNMNMICVRILYALQSTTKTLYLETTNTFLNHLNLSSLTKNGKDQYCTLTPKILEILASNMLQVYEHPHSDFVALQKIQSGKIFEFIMSKAFKEEYPDEELKFVVREYNQQSSTHNNFYTYVCKKYKDDFVLDDDRLLRKSASRNNQNPQFFVICNNPASIVRTDLSILQKRHYEWPELQVKHAFAIEVLRNQNDKRISPKNVQEVYDVVLSSRLVSEDSLYFVAKLQIDLYANDYSPDVMTNAQFNQFVSLYELYNRKIFSVTYESYAGKQEIQTTNKEMIENTLIILDKHYFWSCHAAGVYMYRWVNDGAYPTNEQLKNLYIQCLQVSIKNKLVFTSQLTEAINMLEQNNVEKKNDLSLSSLMYAYYYSESPVYTSFDDTNDPKGYVVSNYPFAITQASENSWTSVLTNSVHKNVFKSPQTIELDHIENFYKSEFPLFGFRAKSDEQYSKESYLLDFRYNLNFESVLPRLLLKSVKFIKKVQSTKEKSRKEQQDEMVASFKQLLEVVVDKERGLLSERDLGFCLALSQFLLLVDVCEKKELLGVSTIQSLRAV